jgi:acetylornithine/succinyldiaminopimelate/putrescine aminotransferase
MNTNQRQIALAVLETLREDLMYGRLNNGSRVLDVADLRQYIYEQMNRIRTNGLMMGLYASDNGQGQEMAKAMVAPRIDRPAESA